MQSKPHTGTREKYANHYRKAHANLKYTRSGYCSWQRVYYIHTKIDGFCLSNNSKLIDFRFHRNRCSTGGRTNNGRRVWIFDRRGLSWFFIIINVFVLGGFFSLLSFGVLSKCFYYFVFNSGVNVYTRDEWGRTISISAGSGSCCVRIIRVRVAVLVDVDLYDHRELWLIMAKVSWDCTSGWKSRRAQIGIMNVQVGRSTSGEKKPVIHRSIDGSDEATACMWV